MSDGSLSQDEIDALLQGSGGLDLGGDQPAAPSGGGAGEPDLDAFNEFIRNAASSQGSNLNSLLGSEVEIGEPHVELISNGTFVESLPDEVVQTVQNFTGSAAGGHSYLFAPEIATTIAGMMMGQEEIELNDAALTALTEAGNTLGGAVASALSERLGGSISAEPGQTRSKAAGDVEVPEGQFAKVTYPVTIEGKEPAELIELFDISVLNQFGSSAQEQASEEDVMADMLGGGGGLDDSLLGGALAQSGGGMSGGQPNPNVQSVQFPSLGGGTQSADQGNISLLMDVYMEMTVELGRTRRLIRDILGMGEGTILELDKLAGEPVDILVNQKLIAKGEVVVIDENFGVRVTEIVDPMERVSEM